MSNWIGSVFHGIVFTIIGGLSVFGVGSSLPSVRNVPTSPAAIQSTTTLPETSGSTVSKEIKKFSGSKGISQQIIVPKTEGTANAQEDKAQIKLLTQEVNDLIAQQKRQSQLYVPQVSQDSTTSLLVLPQKVTYAVINNSGLTLRTTFPVNIHSLSLISFDNYKMATTSFILSPNIETLTADKGQGGFYNYTIPFTIPISQLLAPAGYLGTPLFYISFSNSAGLPVTSQAFAFGDGLPSFIPGFNLSDVTSATVNLKF